MMENKKSNRLPLSEEHKESLKHLRKLAEEYRALPEEERNRHFSLYFDFIKPRNERMNATEED